MHAPGWQHQYTYSSALAMELLQSYAKPSIWTAPVKYNPEELEIIEATSKNMSK